MNTLPSAAPAADSIDVDYVARLARIRLTPEERHLFQEQMERVLGYIRMLERVEVGAVAPTAHPLEAPTDLREDELQPGLDPAEALAAAPEHRRNLVLVPKIVE